MPKPLSLGPPASKYMAHPEPSGASGVRYTFRKPRGALVLLSAAATKTRNGTWMEEPGQLQSLKELRAQCIERGFTVIGELGTAGERPRADDILDFVRGLAVRDLSEFDALLMVIASHGREGQITAWPNPGEDQSSGPVKLRDDIFALFQPPLDGSGTVASRSLVGKPKLFLVDACRSRSNAVSAIEDPLRPTASPAAGGGVYDGLKFDDLHRPRFDAGGAPVMRDADFCFCFATVPFNEAGITDSSSLFLSAIVEQLRDNPRSSFVEQISVANGAMQRRHGVAGQVKRNCFPQCAQIVSTLRKPLYFEPPSDATLVKDMLYTAKRQWEEDPEDNEEIAALRREALVALEKLEGAQQQAKRARTRGEDPTFDTSALQASLMKIAQLVGGPAELTSAAADAVQAACAALSVKADGAVKELLAPLRHELDSLAQLPFEAPPQLTLIAPTEEQQHLSRSQVLRDMDSELFAAEYEAAPPATATSSTARRWTSVQAGAKLHFQMRCQQKGHCYLFHLNQQDQLTVVFPNTIDSANTVPAPGHDLRIPGGFADGGKQYLAFKCEHLEKETFYLLTISKRLEDFEAVGALPQRLGKLQPQQAREVLAVLRRAATGTRVATFRHLDADLFAAMELEDNQLSMALSTMTLISVAREV